MTKGIVSRRPAGLTARQRSGPPGVDETLIAQQLRLSPEQRLAQLESMYEWGRELALAGARARGEPA
jgi:hypothetical protein